MKKLKTIIHNQRGDMTVFTCFFILGTVTLIAFLLFFSSVQIHCINIRNGAKMELNNLSASIYADTYRSQREVNYGEYLRTLYSSSSYTHQLEEMVTDGLESKVSLSNDDYRIRNIRLSFTISGDRVEYVFTCDADFYIKMFGQRYPTVTRQIRLTGYHNVKF